MKRSMFQLLKLVHLLILGGVILFASVLLSLSPMATLANIGWISSALAATSAIPDSIADRVLGQTVFNTNANGSTANTFNWPAGVAIAPDGRLFVADYKNNRVLSWSSALNFTNGQPADLVIGKPDFTTVGTDPDVAGCQAPGASNTSGPESVAVDATGNLYVADTYCHRVLIFQPPFSSGMAASMVLGQPDMITGTGCVGPSNGNKYCYARGVAVDAAGNVFAADQFNHRILQYDSPLTTDTTPDRVFGQPDLNSGGPNQNGAPTANTLKGPRAAAVDAAGNLYVADLENNRVLVYNAPLTTDTSADHVFGQNGSFTTNLDNNGGLSASSLSSPVDLLLDTAGNLYIADVGNQRVLAYLTPLATDTVADSVFGQNNSFTTNTANNGGLSTSSLQGPLGMALDSAGSLYLADGNNNRILVFDPPPASLLNTNLIKNGDAEASAGSNDGATFAPASWRVSQGNFTAVQYGATGGFPSTTDPAPATRGSNFFGGGYDADNTTAEQVIDVSALSSSIDEGSLKFTASGYFGGFGDQDDVAFLEINFKDGNGVFISQELIGSFKAVDRQNQTGLFPDDASGTVPANTRTIQVILQMQRTAGSFNDGYADNLALVLTGVENRVFLPFVRR